MDERTLPMRTMIVDDDRLMRCLLADILGDAGYETHTANNCKQAVVLFDEYSPDLILCDWELPDAAGIDFVRHIRYVQKDRRPFIMMVSAHHSNDSLEKALRAGANDYLAKPIKKRELVARAAEAQRVQFLEQQLQGSHFSGHLTVSHGYYSVYAS